MTPAIRVENLSKSFRIGARQDGYRTLRESLTEAAAAPFRRLHGAARRAFNPDYQGDAGDGRNGETLWALKDVSFDVQPGEVVGIIGRNGAGKSTLLKILSRITEPTNGRIALHGRVGSLLEVGTGFHPELTGRENIYMNGAILGMSRREIDRKFDEIVDFSGVEKFLDTPVKRYSSGMYVRLAFAVAAHLEPEVLVVDEVLAVGDLEFQRRCVGKMNAVARSGRTVLLVSHNVGLIQSLCSRVVQLVQGHVAFDGDTTEGVEHFARHSRQANRDVTLRDADRRPGSGRARVVAVRVIDEEGVPTTAVQMLSRFSIELLVSAPVEIQKPQYCIIISSSMGQRLLRLFTSDTSAPVPRLSGTQRIRCIVPTLTLLPGDYDLTIKILDGNGAHIGTLADEVPAATSITVLPTSIHGVGSRPGSNQDHFYLPCTWDVEATSVAVSG